MMTPILTKIFGTVLYDDLYATMSPKISHFQHGFEADATTITNLCIFCECASKAIAEKTT